MRLGALILAVCLGLGLVETVQLVFGSGEYAEPSLAAALERTLPSWLFLAALSPVAVWTSDRWPVRDAGWLRAIGVHLIVSVPFAVAHLAVTAWWGVVRPGATVDGYAEALTWLLTRYTVYSMLSYGALVGVVHAWRYYRQAARSEGEAAVLVKELDRARLRAVEGKLHPHFVLNTLNAIAGLAARRDGPGVVRTLASFGELLRATLDDRAIEVVSLRQELELLDSYMAIQRVRFGERIRIDVVVPEPLLDRPVPGMLLQPLVENAVRHGVGRDPRGGTVRVEARTVSDGLEVRVRDPGAGTAGRGASGRGIGLDGTRARITSLFGPGARLDFHEPSGGGAEVVVYLPAEVAKA